MIRPAPAGKSCSRMVNEILTDAACAQRDKGKGERADWVSVEEDHQAKGVELTASKSDTAAGRTAIDGAASVSAHLDLWPHPQ
jgi:hypothetical protein